MKLYLSIPYSGMEATSFRVANYVAGKLMEQGHTVFSPISHSHPIAAECDLHEGWEFWKRQDEPFIEWCDELCVVMLKGWKKSKGVHEEIKIAKKLGKPVQYIKYSITVKSYQTHPKEKL